MAGVFQESKAPLNGRHRLGREQARMQKRNQFTVSSLFSMTGQVQILNQSPDSWETAHEAL